MATIEERIRSNIEKALAAMTQEKKMQFLYFSEGVAAMAEHKQKPDRAAD